MRTKPGFPPFLGGNVEKEGWLRENWQKKPTNISLIIDKKRLLKEKIRKTTKKKTKKGHWQKRGD